MRGWAPQQTCSTSRPASVAMNASFVDPRSLSSQVPVQVARRNFPLMVVVVWVHPMSALWGFSMIA